MNWLLAAVLAVIVGIAMVAAGVVWWFGPVGLVGAGVVLAAAGLLLIDVKE